jgi:hypothetical protein
LPAICTNSDHQPEYSGDPGQGTREPRYCVIRQFPSTESLSAD